LVGVLAACFADTSQVSQTADTGESSSGMGAVAESSGMSTGSAGNEEESSGDDGSLPPPVDDDPCSLPETTHRSVLISSTA
jgi:hypothetical protein